MNAVSSRTLTSIVVAALLALVPATAFADGGAGDNQYQDPLTAPAPKKATKKKATTAPASTTTTTTPVTATTAAPAATSTTPAPAAAKDLPRTGEDAWLFALAGVALVVSGAVLRRRIARK
jgi:LPXTG-motif cell wall-anchored protein